MLMRESGVHEEAWAGLWATETVKGQSLGLGLVWLQAALLDHESGWRLRKGAGRGVGEKRPVPPAAAAAGLSRGLEYVAPCLEPGVRTCRQCRPCEVLKISPEKASPQLLKRGVSMDLREGCRGVALVIISHRLGKGVHFTQ